MATPLDDMARHIGTLDNFTINRTFGAIQTLATMLGKRIVVRGPMDGVLTKPRIETPQAVYFTTEKLTVRTLDESGQERTISGGDVVSAYAGFTITLAD